MKHENLKSDTSNLKKQTTKIDFNTTEFNVKILKTKHVTAPTPPPKLLPP